MLVRRFSLGAGNEGGLARDRTGRPKLSVLVRPNFQEPASFPNLADNKYSIVVKISNHTVLYTVEAYSVEGDTNNKQPATPCSGNARRGL